MRHQPSSALLALILSISQTLAHPQGPPGTAGHGHGGGPPPPPNLNDNNYENTVCHPITDYAPNPVPPCMEIETIETICTPNGTSPLDLKAHQQCMCVGSFFPEWPSCLQCLYIHGLRSQRDVIFYREVLSAASTALCQAPTPTAEFKHILESVQGVIPSPTTGETLVTDQAVGQPAVSLYYTAAAAGSGGIQYGPGRITGEATGATATGLLTASGPGVTLGGESGGEGIATTTGTGTGGRGSGSAGSVSTSTAGAGAVNTNGTVRVRRTRSGSWMAAVVAVAAGVVVYG